MKKEKRIIVVEMSVPWIENRDIKYNEKVEKYDGILRKLKREYREYQIEQATFIVDALGGYSTNLKQNIKKLNIDSGVCERILMNLQKVILTEACFIINKFKLITS